MTKVKLSHFPRKKVLIENVISLPLNVISFQLYIVFNISQFFETFVTLILTLEALILRFFVALILTLVALILAMDALNYCSL